MSFHGTDPGEGETSEICNNGEVHSIHISFSVFFWGRIETVSKMLDKIGPF